MRAFWDDCGRGVAGDAAVTVDLDRAKRLWSDGSGAEGNFLGLIDAADRTIQFVFTGSIPDHVEDARRLRIVMVDIPVPERRGSYTAEVTVDEVHRFIEKAFIHGADHRRFAELTFTSW